MDSDQRTDCEKVENKGKKARAKGVKSTGMVEYIKSLIPQGAVLNFVFKEDFDGDGEREALVGFTIFNPFPPETLVLYIDRTEAGLRHIQILSSEQGVEFPDYGIYDGAYAADINGDGIPEFILSLTMGNGHFITPFIFHWVDGEPVLVWWTDESFYHGSLEVDDVDGDGIYEIIINRGTHKGKEILALCEASYHVRESSMYKWDGESYSCSCHQARMPYLSYNTAVAFLTGLWNKEYKKIYEMVVLPGFMGLDGLDDSSITAFKRYVNKMLRSLLEKNMIKGKLSPGEPYDSHCVFSGIENDFSIELIKDKGKIKIHSVNVYPNNTNT